MKFAREVYSVDLVAEMLPLWRKHYEEVAMYVDIKLDPDLQVYDSASTNGMLRIFTVRASQKLVGYQVFFLRTNPHYKSSVQASQDILFIDSEYRTGLVGYRFIRWCDEELKSDDVQVVYQHVKTRHDFSPILIRLGYQPVDLIYARRLDQWV